MNRKNLSLAILAVVLVLGMSVDVAWSYFTDTTMAEGSVPLSVEPTTTITEENGPGTKTIRIRNTGDVIPVWVRVRVYASDSLGANASGDGWSGIITDWYEYADSVDPGAETEPLKITFTLPGGFDPTNNPTGVYDEEEQNIVVVYESAPVIYDASGNPLPANWN